MLKRYYAPLHTSYERLLGTKPMYCFSIISYNVGTRTQTAFNTHADIGTREHIKKKKQKNQTIAFEYERKQNEKK